MILIAGVWIFFIILSLILILLRLNKRANVSYVSLILNFLSFVISFVLVRICVNSTARNVGNEVMKIMQEKYGSNASNLSSLSEFAKFSGSFISSIIMFYIFYLIISLIIFILKRAIIYHKLEENAKLDNREKSLQKVGIVVSNIISVSLTFVVLVTPIGFLYNSFSSAFLKEKQKVPFVSKFYLDKLTEMPDNKNNVSTTDEIYYTLDIFGSLASVSEGNSNYNDDISKIKEGVSSKTYFLPTIVAEVASTGAGYWKDEQEFLEYTPDFPEGREGKLYKDILGIIEKWDKKAVEDDVTTLLNVYGQILDYGVDKFKEENGILNALSENEFTEELFLNLYKNKDFAQMIPFFVEYGLGTVFDDMDIVFDTKSLPEVDISSFSEDDIKREARIVSDVIGLTNDIMALNEKIENGDVDLDDIKEFGDKISKIEGSKIIGNVAEELEFQLENLIPDIEF